MKTEFISMEGASSIRLPVFDISQQTKAKQLQNPAIHSSSSCVSSSERLQSSSRNTLVSQIEGEAGTKAPATVLFVSDDDYLRSTMRAYLEHVGFLVRSSADAERIPDLFFRAQEDGPAVDLLLIDVQALGAIGLRLAAKFACFEPELPVVIIGPPGMEERDLAGIARRGWKFLNKPVLLSRLLGIIRSALEPSPQASPALMCRSKWMKETAQ